MERSALTTDASISRRALLATAAAATACAAVTSCASHSAGAAQAGASGSMPPEPSELVGDPDGYRTTLLLLGTAAGPLFVPSRTGTSSAVVVGDRTYLVDAGPGATRRMGQAGLHPNSLSAIFVTHMHNDHIADLFNLLWLVNPGNSFGTYKGPVQVFGPGPAAHLPAPYGVPSIPIVRPENPAGGTHDMWMRLVHAYAYAYAYAYEINIRNSEQGAPVDCARLADVHDVLPPAEAGATPERTAPDMHPFTVYEDDRTRVSAVLVPHGPVFPSFGYRFDTDEGSITFSGDTARSTNVARLAAGTDVLVHEAINVDYYARAVGGAGLVEHMKEAHTTPDDVGRVASDASAKSVVLSHVGPGDPRIVADQEWEAAVASTYSGSVRAGNDLTRIGVGRPS